MTTPKMICMTCGTDFPVGSECPRCGPHKPGAKLLEALRSHGSGIAPDTFEQSECQDCVMKDQLIKAAGEQIETLSSQLEACRQVLQDINNTATICPRCGAFRDGVMLERVPDGCFGPCAWGKINHKDYCALDACLPKGAS